MIQQDGIEEILHQWALVPQMRVKEPQELTDQELQDMRAFFVESDRREQVEHLHLQESNVYRAASLFQSDPEDELIEYADDDEDGPATMALQQERYVTLSLQLIALDAVDTAIGLIDTLTLDFDEGPERDTIMIDAIREGIIRALLAQGLHAMAWAFVEHPRFENDSCVRTALIIPSVTKSAIDLHRARHIVEREASKFWDHSKFGVLLRTNAVSYWVELWSHSQCAPDIENARRLCNALDRKSRAKGFLAVARQTWDAQDLLKTFEAARQLEGDRERAAMAYRIIGIMAMHVVETDGSSAYRETIGEVARRMTNRRWRRLLLKKAEEFANYLRR